MGISGCGKSLCVKTISTLWNLPLFRLDMNAVFGTDNPECTFLRALRVGRGRLAGGPLDRRDRDGRRRLPRGRRRVDVAHLLRVPDLDAGEERARLRRGDGEPDPPAARRDHPQGPLRPGLLRRPAQRGGAQADLRDPPEEEPLRRRPASTSSSSRRRRRAGTAPRSSRPSSPPSSTPTRRAGRSPRTTSTG